MTTKVTFSAKTGKWMALRKEMIFVGRLSWVILDSFSSKQEAEEYIKKLKEKSND